MAAAAKAMNQQVDKNFAEFQKLLPELLKTHAGKFAVMRDGKVIDCFDSFPDAVKFAHASFGDTNFSIQEVTSQNINLGFYQYALHRSSN